MGGRPFDVGCVTRACSDIRNFVGLSDSLATAGQPSEPQLKTLAAGFEMVVNLGLLDPRVCLPDEPGLIQSLGMAYRHIPVDFNAPRFENLERFFEVMDASRDQRVFVHCAANYRVSAFVALYGEAKAWLVGERRRRAHQTALGAESHLGDVLSKSHAVN